MFLDDDVDLSLFNLLGRWLGELVDKSIGDLDESIDESIVDVTKLIGFVILELFMAGSGIEFNLKGDEVDKNRVDLFDDFRSDVEIDLFTISTLVDCLSVDSMDVRSNLFTVFIVFTVFTVSTNASLFIPDLVCLSNSDIATNDLFDTSIVWPIWCQVNNTIIIISQ